MNSLIIAFPKLADAKRIRDILMKRSIPVHSLCTSAAKALSDASNLSGGIVISSYRLPDMFFRDLNDRLPINFKMILIASKRVLSTYESVDIASVAMPFSSLELVSAIKRLDTSLIIERPKKELRPKARSAAEQAVIDEAKEGLMKRNQMTESEAHKYLQKASMDNGRTLIETAGMILALIKET